MGTIQSRGEQKVCDDGTKLVLIHTLFGMPLFAWYVIEIEIFLQGEVEGTLMSRPFEFHGPFDTRENAAIMVQILFDAHANIEQV